MTISLVNPDLPASLSAAESAELAGRLRALADSGLALEGGLRALAEEIGKPRLSEVLRQLAARLECGEPLAQAIAAPGCRLPIVLRGLILAGVQSGRLPEVLEQFTALDRRRQELRRRVAFTFAYPALLLGFISVLLIFCRAFIADQFQLIFKDFGMKLPAITDIYLHYSGVTGWILLAISFMVILIPLAAAFLRLGSWLGRLLCWVPILGPVAGSERYVQFSRLMATLLHAQVPLPDALTLATIAMQGTMLESQCRAASKAVEAGLALDEAIAQAGFLDSLTCFVYWGQTKNALADAFTAAADAFEVRTTSQAALLNMVVLPAAYLFIITFIGFSLIALIMPLIDMIQNLSSGK